MAGESTAPIVVPITGDVTGLEAAAAKGVAALDKFASSATAGGAKAATGMDTVRATVTALSTAYVALSQVAQQVSRVFAEVAQSAERAEGILRASRNFGIGADALQAWRQAAIESGAEASDLDRALNKLNTTMQEAASGSKEAQETFAALGLNAQALQAQGLEAATKAVSDALARMDDRGKALAIGAELFGKGFRDLTDVFKDGTQGLDAFTAAAKASGVALSAIDLRTLADLDDTLDKAAASAQTLVDRFVIGLAPALMAVTKSLSDFTTAQKDAERAGAGIGKLIEGIGFVASKTWDLTKFAANSMQAIGAAVATPVEILVVGAGQLAGVVDKNSNAVRQWTTIVETAGKEAGKAALSFVGNTKALEDITTAQTGVNVAQAKSNELAKESAAANKPKVDAAAQLLAMNRAIEQAIRNTTEAEEAATAAARWDAQVRREIAAEGVELASRPITGNSDAVFNQQVKDALKAWEIFWIDLRHVDQIGIEERARYAREATARANEQAITDATVSAEMQARAEAGAAEAGAYWDAYNAADAVGRERGYEQYNKDEEKQRTLRERNWEGEQARNLEVWNASWQGRMQIAQQTCQGISGIFGNLANSMDKSSKKGFENWKKMAMAQGIVDTISSAIAAFKSMVGIPYVGYALGAAAAAAALAAGYQNVRRIQNTKFGDTSAPGGGTGYGSSPSSASASAGASGGGGSSNAGGGPGETGPRVVSQTYNITLRGQSFSRDQVRGLLSELQAAQADTGNNYNVATSPGA
jgi:hypothetical protein